MNIWRKRGKMANFGLIKSFSIDNGELDGLSLQHAFVLGYELATIDERLASGGGIKQLVHADNKNRIEKSCNDAERIYELIWYPGDESESWLLLDVAPKH